MAKRDERLADGYTKSRAHTLHARTPLHGCTRALTVFATLHASSPLHRCTRVFTVFCHGLCACCRYRAAVEAAWAQSTAAAGDEDAMADAAAKAEQWAEQLSFVDPAELPQVRD